MISNYVNGLVSRKSLSALILAAASCSVLTVSTPVLAGSAEAGELVSIDHESDRLVLVYSNGERFQVPGCASESPKWWAIDPSTVAGKEQLRELAALRESNKKVRIVGTGECHGSRDAETISFFYPVSDNPTVPNQ